MTLINQKNLLGENSSFLILYLLSGARQAGLEGRLGLGQVLWGGQA